MRFLRMAAAAAVGLLALGACGTEQGAALFVGDERITEATVDGYVEEAADRWVDPDRDLFTYDYSADRYGIMVYLIYAEIGHAVGLDPVPGGDELDTLRQEYSAYSNELFAQAEPRPLTNEEWEGVAVDENLARAAQADLEQLAGYIDDLNEYVAEFDVSVNPRYGQVDLSPFPSVFPVEIPQR